MFNQVYQSQGFSYGMPYYGMNTSQISSNDLFKYGNRMNAMRPKSLAIDSNIASEETTMSVSSSPIMNDIYNLLSSYYCICEEQMKAPAQYNSAVLPTQSSLQVDFPVSPHFSELDYEKGPSLKIVKPIPIRGSASVDDVSSSKSEKQEETKNLNKQIENIITTNYIESIKRKDGASTTKGKRRKFHLRQDVITKTIFRSLRKYFIKDFKSFYDFSKSSSLVGEGKLLEKAQEYITKTVGESSANDAEVFLLSLVDTKRKFINLSAQHEQLREKLAGLLYNFNKLKMDELLQQSGFASLVLHFLNLPSIVGMVLKVRHDGATMDAYHKLISGLKQKCTEAINN